MSSGGRYADAKRLYDFLSECPPLPPQADLILAAGSHDTRVADHAAKLYHQGLAPLVVCTGGFGKVTDGLFREPEAEVFARRCRAAGVPESALIVEDRAGNTGENFTLSRALLASRGIFPKSGIIACKPYMAKRTWATGTKQWPEVQWYPSGLPLSFEDYATDAVPLEESIQLMVGDLQRLRVYEELGYQAHVELPESVWRAYERLVAEGYTRYVIGA